MIAAGILFKYFQLAANSISGALFEGRIVISVSALLSFLLSCDLCLMWHGKIN